MAANRSAARLRLVPDGSQRVVIVPAEISHVYLLAANMRAGDAAEAAALGAAPRRLLRETFRRRLIARTAFVDGEIAAMWGLNGDILSDTGTPWLVTTPAIERIPVTLVRQARIEVAAMREIKARLENHVAAGYTRAVRFLEVLGFVVDPPAPFGREGALFRRFWMGD